MVTGGLSPWVSPFSIVPLGPLSLSKISERQWCQMTMIIFQRGKAECHSILPGHGARQRMDDSERQWVTRRSGQCLGHLVGLLASVVLGILPLLSR